MLDILEKKIADPNSSILSIFKSKKSKMMDDLVKLSYEECIDDAISYVKMHEQPSAMNIIKTALNGKMINIFFNEVPFLADDVKEKTFAMILNGLPIIYSVVEDISLNDGGIENISQNDLMRANQHLNDLTLIFFANMETQSSFEAVSKVDHLFEHIKDNIGVDEFIFPGVKRAFLQTKIMSFGDYIKYKF